MPANKPRRPMLRPALTVAKVGDAAVERAIGSVASAVQRIESLSSDRVTFSADLAVGDNILTHHLARKPDGYTLTPTVADASFAHALKAKDDKTITITVIGVAQLGAVIEVYASTVQPRPTTAGVGAS